MPDKTWKQAERRVAKIFNGKRTPLSGRNSLHTSSDVIHEKLYIEVKYKKDFPLVRLWRDTEKKSRKEKKDPLLTLVPKKSKVVYALVPLDKQYLKKLLSHL